MRRTLPAARVTYRRTLSESATAHTHSRWSSDLGTIASACSVVSTGQSASFRLWPWRSVHTNPAFIHVIPASDPDAALQFDLEERVQSTERRAARHRLDDLQKRVGSHVRVHIAMGAIKDALTEAAGRLQADLLVIGRSPQAGVRLRDLTYAVVRDAPCPVLSV